MGLMNWLFGDLEGAQRAALARIDAIKAKHDEYDQATAPMMAVAQRVLPMLRAIEELGRRPAAIYLPPQDMAAMEEAARAHDKMFARTDHAQHGVIGARLFGVPIKPGSELRVV